MKIKKEKVFIVFSDLKGFSTLTKEDKEIFLQHHLFALSNRITVFLKKAIAYNTWGDAIIAIFENGANAVEFMIEYREFSPILKSKTGEDKIILPRIAGHYGEVNLFDDPLLGKTNMLGVEINTAARIEPITRPGEVFVTKEFKKAFEIQQGSQEAVAFDFDELGLVPLAKDFGDKELFRLRKIEEKPQVIDTLFKKQIESALPAERESTETEKKVLYELGRLTDQTSIGTVLQEQWLHERTGAFCIKVAELCKKVGLYKEGLKWIEKAQESYIETGGIHFYQYRTKKQVIKLQADLLTRESEYAKAANLLYDLWRNIEDEKSKDASEILAMLAAQLKRRAITNGRELLKRDEIDHALLKKAADLYLEAFRRDIGDYYPAINAAYLQVMLGEELEQSGKELAYYIQTVWSKDRGKNHWLDFTLAECFLLEGKFDQAAVELKQAIENHINNLGVFDIETTKIQILQYLRIMDVEDKGKGIICILESALSQKRSHTSLST